MTKIAELMTTDVACCTPDTTLGDIARMMNEFDCGEIPVVDDGDGLHPVGVVTDRDIVCRVLAVDRNPLAYTAADCMSEPCVTVSFDSSVDDCCRILEEHRIRRAPVVTGDGRCCGIVSLADLVRAERAGTSTARLVHGLCMPSPQSPVGLP